MADLTLNPCADAVAQAAYTKLLMSDDPADFTASGGAKRLHFLGENISEYSFKRNDQGITGDLWKLASRFNTGQTFIYGPMYFACNAGEMAYLLPYLIGGVDGGTGGSTDYTPTSCVSPLHFKLLRDYGIWTYTYCYAASWSVSARALRFREESLADMVILTVNWIGKTKTFQTDASYWPVADEPELGSTAEFTPYYYKHCRWWLNSVNYSAYAKDFQLQVNRNLNIRYRMSTSPTAVVASQRDVRLDVGMDWNSTTKTIYNLATNPPGRLRVAMDETPTCYTDFHFGACVPNTQDPASKQRLEDVDWRMVFECAADDPSAGTYDIWATNDDTV